MNMIIGIQFWLLFYRYASDDRRDLIVYFIIKAISELGKTKLPVYYRDEVILAQYQTTKEEKKSTGYKKLAGDCK